MKDKLHTDHVLSLLCCPQCRASLSASNEAVICTSCSRNYPIVSGIVDFRQDDLDLTAGFFIENDRHVADILQESFAGRTYFELYDLYFDAMQRGKPLNSTRQAAMKNYRRALKETHLVHGEAILRKISNYTNDLDREFSRGVALEDGAGLGQFIPGFSRHFDVLLVLDLSLCYLLLAKKLVEELGLNNVILICGNVERLPVTEGVIDFVHSNNMIEHVLHSNVMFEEAKRVLRLGGLFFMLSPNRFSLYIEPHYRLPAFGFIPMPLRRLLVRLLRGRDDLEDIRLHSLGEVKRLARESFGPSFGVAFLPRVLGETTLKTPIRGLIRSALESRVIGGFAHLLLNRIFLAVMPYHVVLCFKDADTVRVSVDAAR